MELDWIDILAHGAIGFAIGVAAVLGIRGSRRTGLAPSLAAIIALNGAFWFFREAVQHSGNPVYPFAASLQTNLEWLVPLIACPLGARLLLRIAELHRLEPSFLGGHLRELRFRKRLPAEFPNK